jgi:hypothetical protein
LTNSELQHDQGTFFEGIHRVPRFIIAVGGCLLLASFCVEGAQGIGRAVGLCGIGVIMCGLAVNLTIHARAEGPQSHRHLIVQMLLASLVAVAAFWLAGYLYHYGVMPKFLTERYH